MINKKFYILVLFVLLISASCVYADNIMPGKSDEPMEITSDRMEAFNEKKVVVFSGNAMARQGNNVLKADKLLLYYKADKAGKKDKIGTIETEKTGDLEKIEAKGNVSLTQEGRVATGEDAVYFRDSNKVILTGNPVLKEGKNSIRGDRVTVFLNENRGVVESNTQRQVKAIIYPQDKKKPGLK